MYLILYKLSLALSYNYDNHNTQITMGNDRRKPCGLSNPRVLEASGPPMNARPGFGPGFRFRLHDALPEGVWLGGTHLTGWCKECSR